MPRTLGQFGAVLSRKRPASWVASLAAIGLIAVMPAQAAPDITGVWNRYPPYPDTFSKEPEPPELQLVEPPLREPHLRAWRAMQKRRADADAAGKPLPTPSSKCRPEGMPGIMGAHYALELLQSQRQVTVLAEFMSQARRIYLDEAMPPTGEVEPTYNGYAVGTWSGDTLLVTTLGVRPDVLYSDIPHSDKMKISERMQLVAPDILQDDITIEDPEYLTGPYRFTFKYRREKPDYKIAEYVCDNDRGVIEKDGSMNIRTDGERGRQASRK